MPRFVPREVQQPSPSNLMMSQQQSSDRQQQYHHHHSSSQLPMQAVTSPAPPAPPPPPPPPPQPDSYILDLQNQITEMTRECTNLRSELEAVRERLASTMNSIRSFWSPELKKERQLRKEESARYSMLSEQYRLLQAESQVRSLFTISTATTISDYLYYIHTSYLPTRALLISPDVLCWGHLFIIDEQSTRHALLPWHPIYISSPLQVIIIAGGVFGGGGRLKQPWFHLPFSPPPPLVRSLYTNFCVFKAF